MTGRTSAQRIVLNNQVHRLRGVFHSYA